jgi:hypothetical protein
MSNDLVLHLTLDEIRGGKFLDASGSGRDGVVKGNVTLVPDDVFGACANFDGNGASYIEVPDSADLQLKGDITLEAWIQAPGPAMGWVRVLGKGAAKSRNYGLWYNKSLWLFQRMSGMKVQDCEIATSKLPLRPDTWYHLAAVLRAKDATLYIHDLQGLLLPPAPQKVTWDGASLTSADPLTIGYAGYEKAHNGKIANVRVYNRALSQAEIERDIRADSMSLVAFRKSHPIDFSLYDDDEQAVLYISDDSDGRNLNLELRNTSTQAIQLSNGQNARASEANHHFALRFRPGTLSDSSLKLLINSQERAKILKQTDAQWDLYFPPTLPAANEASTLYLFYKGSSKSFQPDEIRRLTLQRMSAAPGSGARGTQVELIPRQLTAAGGDATPITGSRAQYVHITNHQGKKNVPLHVGFVGGNSVLNDGETQNKLTLRVSNVSKKGELALTSMSDRKPSKFIVSFDVELQGQDKEWALVKSAAAQNVKVRVDKNVRGGKNEIKPGSPGPTSPAASFVASLPVNPLYSGADADAQEVKVSGDVREIEAEGINGETPEWPITFDKAVRLDAGEHIQIEITGIVSSLPSGHANLYLRYENIPGYWDGQFVCAVEKGPVVYKEKEGERGKGRVGIGTAEPIEKLEVAGSIVADSLTVARANDRGGVFFAKPGDFNHVIYNNYSNFDGGGAWNGATWNTGEGLRLKVGHDAQKKLAFAINEKGNVGIGANPSNYQLDVKSSTPIKLGLEGNGGGQLVIANEANDNKVYLEALSSDGNGHAAEFLLTGKGGAPVPKLSLLADTTQISGNLSLSSNSIVTFPPGCKIVGVPSIAMKRFIVSSPGFLESLNRGPYFTSEVKNGLLEWEGTVEFASRVQSAEAIVSYVQSSKLNDWNYDRIGSEGQYVEIKKISNNNVHLLVRVWRQYRNNEPIPKQSLAAEIVVIAVLGGV